MPTRRRLFSKDVIRLFANEERWTVTTGSCTVPSCTSSISNIEKSCNKSIKNSTKIPLGKNAKSSSPTDSVSSSVLSPRLGKEVRFSPPKGEKSHASAPVVTDFVGSEKVKNLVSFLDPNTTFTEVMESEKIHQNIAKRFLTQNSAKTILYRSKRSEIDNDPNFAHLSEIERHYLAMNSHNTIKCQRVRTRAIDNVGVRVDQKHKKAFFTGTHQCGSVWACRPCAVKIQTRRGIEIQKAYKWAYENKKYQVALITLTFPHKISDSLEDSLKKFTLAMKYFRKGKNYDEYKDFADYQGTMKSVEMTYGKNGWHLHSHEGQIIAYGLSAADEKRIRKFIMKKWQQACTKAGLLKHGQIADFQKVAVDIIFHSKSSDYIAKLGKEDEEVKTWGADSELAGSTNKISIVKGMSPWQLLDKAETNENYKALWLEYALTMKGKKQLVWSKGLKEKVGLKEKSDEDIAKEQTSSADLLALLSDEQWRIVLRIDPIAKKKDDRAYILWLAVNVGFEGLATYFKGHNSKLLTIDEIDLNVDIRIIENEQEKRADREAKKTKPPTAPIESPPTTPPMTAEEVLKMYNERYVKVSS